MLKELFLVTISFLYRFKYWIVLLSLLVVGFSYEYVNKSSVFVSGVEFVNYEDAGLFDLEVGDEVLFNGKKYILTEELIIRTYKYVQQKNNEKFNTVATSKIAVYEFLLSRKVIDGNSIIIGNYLLDLLKLNDLTRLEQTNISELSLNEKITLRKLYNQFLETTKLQPLEGIGNFMLTTNSNNKSFANFLPINYYHHLITYLESAETEKLLKDFVFYKNKNESVEKSFTRKENHYWSLIDQHKGLSSESDLITFQMLEDDMEILERELNLSRSYFGDIENRVAKQSSQFYLISQLFIPIEYKKSWVKKFLMLSLIGLIFCFLLLVIIQLINSFEYKSVHA